MSVSERLVIRVLFVIAKILAKDEAVRKLVESAEMHINNSSYDFRKEKEAQDGV